MAGGGNQPPLCSNLHVMYSRIKMLDPLLVVQVLLVLLLDPLDITYEYIISFMLRIRIRIRIFIYPFHTNIFIQL